jgi:hypothetical protein
MSTWGWGTGVQTSGKQGGHLSASSIASPRAGGKQTSHRGGRVHPAATTRGWVVHSSATLWRYASWALRAGTPNCTNVSSLRFVSRRRSGVCKALLRSSRRALRLPLRCGRSRGLRRRWRSSNPTLTIRGQPSTTTDVGTAKRGNGSSGPYSRFARTGTLPMRGFKSGHPSSCLTDPTHAEDNQSCAAREDYTVEPERRGYCRVQHDESRQGEGQEHDRPATQATTFYFCTSPAQRIHRRPRPARLSTAGAQTLSSMHHTVRVPTAVW